MILHGFTLMNNIILQKKALITYCLLRPRNTDKLLQLYAALRKKMSEREGFRQEELGDFNTGDLNSYFDMSRNQFDDIMVIVIEDIF